MQVFIVYSNPKETGRRWKKWKNELVTRFRISNTQDCIDALHIYEGKNMPSPTELLNEYEKIIGKLDNHFIPWSTPTVPVNQGLSIVCVYGCM